MKMVVFTPAANFVGYPSGTKVEFLEDVESQPVPEQFGELMRTKGLIKHGTQLRQHQTEPKAKTGEKEEKE